MGTERTTGAVLLRGFAALRLTGTAAGGVWSGVRRSHNRDAVGSGFGMGPRVVLVPRTNPGLGDRTPLALGCWVLVSCGEAGSCRFPTFCLLEFFAANELRVF